MDRDFKDKTILFLVHSYNSFEKDQIELIAGYFKKVFVLVRYKPIAEISRFLPVNSAKDHIYKIQFNTTNTPGNVMIIPVPLWYLPFDFFYRRLGNYHLNVVNRLLKRHKLKFDIIHAHFIWTAGYVGVKLHEKYSVPVIITGHGGDVYDYPFRNEFWRKKTFNILSSADSVITVSQRNFKCIRRIGIQKDINVIPNGFLPAFFYPKSKDDCRIALGLPKGRKIIVSVGFLGIVKGHKYLIDAIKIVTKTDTNVLCLIIGDGELRNSLKNQIYSLGIQNNVRLIGRVLHNELVNWYNSADLFVLPSLSEGLSVSQIEAMACGTPVVATLNGGSEEIITKPELGFLSEKANQIDLAGKIEMALSKKWDEDEIIKHAQKFTWGNAVGKILTIYRLHLK